MHLCIDTIKLKSGAHPQGDDACVMELVSCLAKEPWSDSPKCVSPIIAAFMRNWNDNMSDEDRQQLKVLVPVVMNTATNNADELTRSWMAMDWLVRSHVPAWLDLAGLTAEAKVIRAHSEITDAETLAAMMPKLIEGQKKATAAGYAARDAAGYAAGAAAGYAAGDAAWAAAGDAAWAAAGAAAWAAAGDAAGAKLRPTVIELQASAIELVKRMANVGR